MEPFVFLAFPLHLAFLGNVRPQQRACHKNNKAKLMAPKGQQRITTQELISRSAATSRNFHFYDAEL